MFKTIPSRKLEDCTIFSNGRLLVWGILINISIMLWLNYTPVYSIGSILVSFPTQWSRTLSGSRNSIYFMNNSCDRPLDDNCSTNCCSAILLGCVCTSALKDHNYMLFFRECPIPGSFLPNSTKSTFDQSNYLDSLIILESTGLTLSL